MGVATSDQQKNVSRRIVPHARTLRKARDQVMWMVKDGFSAKRWTVWWANTTELWTYEELLKWFIRACWDVQAAGIAAGLLQRRTIILSSSLSSETVVQAAG